MVRRIDIDRSKFDAKIKKLGRDALKRYFQTNAADLPKPDGRILRIPFRRLRLPKFRYGDNSGVGQGDGDVGQPVPGMNGDENRQGHGEGPGDHAYAEFTAEEAAEILGEHLKLPNLLEKYGGTAAEVVARKYTGISIAGPESLRHAKRTFKRALLRSISSGTYDPVNPRIIPIHDDKRYKAAKTVTKPTTKALLIYLLDYSGSMGGVIDFLQNVGWWADAWITKHYSKITRRYLQYDHAAREVKAADFYRAEAGGGTSMGAGLSLAKRIAKEYPEEQYNCYLIHFTDGDCTGIEFTEQMLANYRTYAQMYPDMYKYAPTETGNPLTGYLLKRCNALFVCEAGAFYGDARIDPERGPQGNYSGYLKLLTEETPSLEQKVRCASYEEKEISGSVKKCIFGTLRHWFG